MTTDDICDLIDKMRRHLYALDKGHIRSLYNLATNKGAKISYDKRYDARVVLAQLESVAERLEKRDIKRLFRVAMYCGSPPKCAACGESIVNIQEFSWDHTFPHSKGGSDKLYNLMPMHKICNERKGAQIFDDLYDVQYTIIVEPVVVLIEPQKSYKNKPYRKGKKIKPWQIHKKQR